MTIFFVNLTERATFLLQNKLRTKPVASIRNLQSSYKSGGHTSSYGLSKLLTKPTTCTISHLNH